MNMASPSDLDNFDGASNSIEPPLKRTMLEEYGAWLDTEVTQSLRQARQSTLGPASYSSGTHQ